MKKLFYLIPFLCLIGCSSVEKAQSKFSVIEVDNKSTSLFNGTYSNKCDKCEAEIYSLWSSIFYNADKNIDWKDLLVRIEIQSDKTLIAELIKDNKVIDNFSFDGQLADNYFLLKKQWKTDFKYIILWALGDSSVKLAINENKEIVVLRESGGVALLVAFPVYGANSPLLETSYKRVN